MNDGGVVTLLLDIKEQQGKMAEQLAHAAASSQALAAGQAAAMRHIDDLQATVQPLVTAVADMKPKVEEGERFRIRFGAYVWISGGIATAILMLLWQGLLAVWPTIRGLLHG